MRNTFAYSFVKSSTFFDLLNILATIMSKNL